MAGKEDPCPMSEKAEIAVGGSSEVVGGEPAAAAVKVDPPLAEEDYSKINWVEMPLNYLRWVLSMTREIDPAPKLEDYGIYTEEDLDSKDPDMLIRKTIALLQAGEDDFFEYQAWVREVYQRNGRVMIPEGVLGPKDELQKAIKEAWGDGGFPRETDSSFKEI